MATPLWKTDHPYYCQEGNYFAGDLALKFDSWGEFLAEMGDADEDYNLVFRWDWKEGQDWDIPEGEARLCVFYMGQRKAKCWSATVKVSRSLEPEISTWLEKKWLYLQKLWTPFTEATNG